MQTGYITQDANIHVLMRTCTCACMRGKGVCDPRTHAMHTHTYNAHNNATTAERGAERRVTPCTSTRTPRAHTQEHLVHIHKNTRPTVHTHTHKRERATTSTSWNSCAKPALPALKAGLVVTCSYFVFLETTVQPQTSLMAHQYAPPSPPPPTSIPVVPCSSSHLI
jgi:hypothetical protein